MHKLFVYGTLRKGEPNHGLLGTSRCLFPQARVKGVLVDTGCGFPAMREGDGDVLGEIYEVDDETLARTDDLEDYFGPGDPRNLYERVLRAARTATGELDVWVYVSERFGSSPVIPSGDWVKRGGQPREGAGPA
jgi:gamma-L-glutamyl-butirosin B gamma-L-glutamyl cyclotransferase